MLVKQTMPMVSGCGATECAYNQNQKCHAKAVTIGHVISAECDTHISNKQCSTAVDGAICAGVGACKMSDCMHNRNLECEAKQIRIGASGGKVKCLTYAVH